MRRALIGLALGAVFCAAHTAAAQDMFTNAKKAAQKAANAENAHVDAEQHPEPAQKATPKADAPKPDAPKSDAPKAEAPKAVPQQQGAARNQPGKQAPRLNVAKADTMTVPTIIYREAFEFNRDGRRDPFVSLLTTNELRPELSDLTLSSIVFDPSGRRSIAIMRDMTNKAQYRVTTGSALGRMRVAGIHVLSVVFTIEEFGTSRTDSLVLRDSTKRAR